MEQLVEDRFGRAFHVAAGEGGFDVDRLARDLGPLVTGRLGQPGQPARNRLGPGIEGKAARAERPVELRDGREHGASLPTRLP